MPRHQVAPQSCATPFLFYFYVLAIKLRSKIEIYTWQSSNSVRMQPNILFSQTASFYYFIPFIACIRCAQSSVLLMHGELPACISATWSTLISLAHTIFSRLVFYFLFLLIYLWVWLKMCRCMQLNRFYLHTRVSVCVCVCEVAIEKQNIKLSFEMRCSFRTACRIPFSMLFRCVCRVPVCRRAEILDVFVAAQ